MAPLCYLLLHANSRTLGPFVGATCLDGDIATRPDLLRRPRFASFLTFCVPWYPLRALAFSYQVNL